MTSPELDIDSWISRCTKRLMSRDPNSPLDGTDWDDIAGDMWAADPRRAPEIAADEWQRVHGLLRVVAKQ